MRECICCQCSEHSGQFKDYVQCEACQLFGHVKDEFGDDPSLEHCNDCWQECQRLLKAEDREEDSGLSPGVEDMMPRSEGEGWE
jgi:predicted HD phosphohydrolase